MKGYAYFVIVLKLATYAVVLLNILLLTSLYPFYTAYLPANQNEINFLETRSRLYYRDRVITGEM